MLYKSEMLQPGFNQFKELRIPLSFLCNGDTQNCEVFFSLKNSSNIHIEQWIGKNVDGWIEGPATINTSPSITITMGIHNVYTFIDYLKGGMQIHMSIGIDFTGSNGHPLDEGSLHSTKSDKMNSYEKAIRTCGDILAYYDYDQMFPVFGYGAILPGQRDANHCFPLNLTNDPNINQIDGVLMTYRNTLKQITLSGPTNFAPLIRACIQNVRQNINESMFHYSVLLILTDGMICDMRDTVDAIFEASSLPLSIVIIGIGDADFTNMDQLDGDTQPLVDSKNRMVMRDIVQFVPFNKFNNRPEQLAQEVLAEIPKQVVDFYRFSKIPPGDPIVNI
jgi:hypothetical protein